MPRSKWIGNHVRHGNSSLVHKCINTGDHGAAKGQGLSGSSWSAAYGPSGQDKTAGV